jgi:diguanylate cyclase (GGDEF)-like protein/PAS domain S-box-containing protein
MPSTKKKTSKAKAASPSADVKKLRQELARLKREYTKIALEKNFLERAMSDLNFHDNAHDGVVYTDASNRIVYANPYFLTMMGVDKKSEVIDKSFPTYMWNDGKEAERLFRDIKTDGFVREREMALYNRNGQAVFAMCSGVASKDENGNVIGTEIMFCNITSKRMFQAQLMEQNAVLDTILQSTPDPVLVLNSALDVLRSNPAAVDLFKLEKRNTSLRLHDLLTRVLPDKEKADKLEAKFLGEQPFDMEISLGDGYFDLHAAPLKSAEKGWVCVLHDITQRKETQDMLQRHAFHDPLTQLPNRAYFTDFLLRANLRMATEPDYRFSLLFIDLDGLKKFNDQYGHQIGDEMLIHFARRLEASIRPGDLAARLGGDEFAIFLDQVTEEAHAIQIAERVRENIGQPYKLHNQENLHTTASIGIALSGASTQNIENLLRNADRAMYRVKDRGGNDFEIFTEGSLVKPNKL